MRVLFTSLPAVGHVTPLAALAEALAARGHEIVWAAHAEVFPHLRPANATRHTLPAATRAPAPARERPLLALRRYFSEVLPAATAAMLPDVTQALSDHAPDVVITEQSCLAGAIAARQAGLPWVCVHVTPILLLRPFRPLPGVEPWIDAQIAQIQRDAGLAPLPWPLRSPRTLVASSRAFLGDQADLHDSDEVVGALVQPPAPLAIDDWIGPRPRVVVTLGTETGVHGAALLTQAARDLAPRASVLVLTDQAIEVPASVRVAAWAPLSSLMPHLDAVVTHGGQGTVHEALLHGVPLIIAPVQFDQPGVAARVSALGAGLRIPPTGVGVGEAVGQVLAEPAFALAARSIGRSLAGGPARAAAIVEDIVRA